jgi:hypothetical protein
MRREAAAGAVRLADAGEVRRVSTLLSHFFRSSESGGDGGA